MRHPPQKRFYFIKNCYNLILLMCCLSILLKISPCLMFTSLFCSFFIALPLPPFFSALVVCLFYIILPLAKPQQRFQYETRIGCVFMLRRETLKSIISACYFRCWFTFYSHNHEKCEKYIESDWESEYQRQTLYVCIFYGKLISTQPRKKRNEIENAKRKMRKETLRGQTFFEQQS